MSFAVGIFFHVLRDRRTRRGRVACRGRPRRCDRRAGRDSSRCPSLVEGKAQKPQCPSRCSIVPGRVLDCTGFEGFHDPWGIKLPGSLRVEARLGGGAFGQVFKATDALERQVAVKVLNRKAHENDPFLNVLLWREVENHKSLDHPNVARAYGILQTSDYVFLMQELCDGGNLFRFSCKKNRTEAEIKSVVRGILRGLEYCHAKQVVHADIKPENVLLCSGSGRDGVTAKLADFGHSLKLHAGRQWRGAGALVGDHGDENEVGTAAYAAPEMFDQRLCSTKVDMWALGVVVFELFYETVPFEDVGRPCASSVRFGASVVSMSDDAKAFIRALLTENVEARLTSAQALKHRWMRC